MTKEEWAKLVLSIKDLYPAEKILNTDHAIQLWYEMLKDIDYQDLAKGLWKYALENKFPPTISDLRGQSVAIKFGEFSSWEDEWHRVCKTIQNYGYMREQEAIASLPEMTRTIVKRLGYQYLCSSENPMADRANFRDIYNNMVNKQKDREKLSQPIRQALEKATESRNAVLVIKAEELPDKVSKDEIDVEENALSEHVQGKLDELRRRLRGEDCGQACENSFNNFEQRTYDYEALEKKLYAKGRQNVRHMP